jgi:hypothetical protein
MMDIGPAVRKHWHILVIEAFLKDHQNLPQTDAAGISLPAASAETAGAAGAAHHDHVTN